jgi:hypothetical protein
MTSRLLASCSSTTTRLDQAHDAREFMIARRDDAARRLVEPSPERLVILPRDTAAAL